MLETKDPSSYDTLCPVKRIVHNIEILLKMQSTILTTTGAYVGTLRSMEC